MNIRHCFRAAAWCVALAQLVLVRGQSAEAANIAWFYALEGDHAAFAKLAAPPLRSVTIGKTTLQFHQVGSHTVCAVRMGSGCAVTAAAVATCLARFPADRVISTGPAGALDASLPQGTWHQAGKVVAWQKGRAENGRILPGKSAATEIPDSAGDWPRGEWLAFPKKAVASGEAFVASALVRDDIARDTACDLVEMNLAGLASAMDGHSLPLLVLRVVSDHADESADADFASFLKSYGGKGGEIVYRIASALPPDPGRPESHESLQKLLDAADGTGNKKR